MKGKNWIKYVYDIRNRSKLFLDFKINKTINFKTKANFENI